ncbi:MAG TPA: sugar phosphate isomerase/epimerase [Bacteroides sp.]|nr:sugar phosphate isomerase/epimerase [Bacteroides sp.]
MKRKEFLLFIVAASGMGIPMLARAAGRRKKMPVSLHIWVYAKNMPGYDVSPILVEIFSDLEYAGLDGVELMEHPLRDPGNVEIIAELIDRYGVALTGTSYGADMWDRSKHSEILEDVDNIMTNLAALKARTFGTSVGHPLGGRLKTEQELDAQATLLLKMIEMGKRNGIVLNLHNHTYEVENELFDLKGTLKRIPDVKLGPDLNWLLRAGLDPIWFLNEFREKIVFMHLRDQLQNGKWPESLGEGDVDFVEIGDTLKDIGFQGDVVIELAHEKGFTPTRALRDSIKMSRDYVRKTMGI